MIDAPLVDRLVVRCICQIDADEFLVIADEHTPLGECRMVPDHFAPKTFPGRFQNMKTSEFFVSLTRQAGQNQIPRFAEEEEAILMFDQKCGRLPFRRSVPEVGALVDQRRFPSSSCAPTSAPERPSTP